MVSATFRFYEELNDFLAPELRNQEFTVPCARAATTKHMIEALGVPHTEVELILVNGESADFNRQLEDGDRVTVYPRFEAMNVTPLLRVREHPLRNPRFVADAHLGGLARMLRMLGFDTLYDNHFHKGYVYRGPKPVYWCIHDKTALAEAEVEYEEHTSHSIYVRYHVLSDLSSVAPELKGREVYVVIWT